MNMKLDEMSKTDLLDLGKSLNLKVDGRMKESSLIEAIMGAESESIEILYDGDNIRALNKDELILLAKSINVKANKRMNENTIIEHIVAGAPPESIDIQLNTDERSMVSPQMDGLDIEVPDEVIDAEQAARYIEDSIVDKEVDEPELLIDAVDEEVNFLVASDNDSLVVPDEDEILVAEEYELELAEEIEVVEALKELETVEDADEDGELIGLTEEALSSSTTIDDYVGCTLVCVDDESPPLPNDTSPPTTINDDDEELVSIGLGKEPLPFSVERSKIVPTDIKKLMYGFRGKDKKRITQLGKETCDALYSHGIQDAVNRSIQAGRAPLVLQNLLAIEKLWMEQGYLLVRNTWNSWWISFDKNGNRD